MYLLKEIAVIAVAAVAAMSAQPAHYWTVVGLVVSGYSLLCFLSALAFRGAIGRGLVREARAVEGARRTFFIAEGCPNRWLVRRHIRIFG